MVGSTAALGAIVRGRLLPFHSTVAVDVKPEPNTIGVKPALPCWTVFGLRLVMVGDVEVENGEESAARECT